MIGSGREELTRTLAGFAPHDGGTLTVGGRAVRFATPAEAVDAGMGYIPRERRVEGLVLFLPVAANITLADLASLTRYGIIDTGASARWPPAGSTGCASAPRASTPSASTSPAATSRRWCSPSGWRPRRKVLILDHPTRGLDVGAKEEVYELVRAVTAEGLGVILTSDTLEETIGLSHTVLVMRDGAITHRADANPGAKPRQVDLIGHMV